MLVNYDLCSTENWLSSFLPVTNHRTVRSRGQNHNTIFFPIQVQFVSECLQIVMYFQLLYPVCHKSKFINDEPGDFFRSVLLSPNVQSMLYGQSSISAKHHCIVTLAKVGEIYISKRRQSPTSLIERIQGIQTK